MDLSTRCQSCGMPVPEGFFGTEVNGSFSKEYCHYCYRNGKYVEPFLTVEDMINKSVTHMIRDLKMEREVAVKLADDFIPKLKRWQTI